MDEKGAKLSLTVPKEHNAQAAKSAYIAGHGDGHTQGFKKTKFRSILTALLILSNIVSTAIYIYYRTH